MTFPADYQVAESRRQGRDLRGHRQGGEDRWRNQDRRGFRQVARPAEPRPAEGPDPRPAEQELNGLTRTHMKRQLLDQLAERHDFPVPRVDGRGGAPEHPWPASARSEPRGGSRMRRSPRSRTDAAEYRRIAERRVRLGLLLSEIGAANGIQVSEQEMQPADRPGRLAISGQGPRDLPPAMSSRSRCSPPSCARRCMRTRSSTSSSPRPR